MVAVVITIDCTVFESFWSMPENTAHPTQTPEKLLAKIILASMDLNNERRVRSLPWIRYLRRRCEEIRPAIVGVEIDPTNCGLALKRLDMAETDKTIQGYSNGVFWERNTANTVVNDRALKHSLTDDRQSSLLSLILFQPSCRSSTRYSYPTIQNRWNFG